MAELFFQGTDNLTAVLERLRVLDSEFEGESRDRHGG